ncbi:MAG: AEC family transporter [Gammaproteobacteria bacterium]|nr:AEC family transporter [Gammaproteobacteria bacterium]
MAQQIFNIVFPVFSIVLVGYLYGRRHSPDMAAANRLNLEIFIPALVFHVVSGKEFDLGAYQELALAAAIVILGSGLLAWPIALATGYKPKTFVPPMMFSNSGNMGIPLALFAFGEEAMEAAVMLFIIENSLHFSIGLKMLDWQTSILGLLRNPILLATLAGLMFNALNIELPAVVITPIEMVGQIAIPLLLFALGVRFNAVDFKDWEIGLVGALVCPLTGIVIALLVTRFIELSTQQFSLLIIFGALPPAVLNFMVAEKYNQEPTKVASIVMLANLASVVIIPVTLAFVLF